MNRNFVFLGMLAMSVVAAGCGHGQEQQSQSTPPPQQVQQTPKQQPTMASSDTIIRGKQIFDSKCGLCHYPDSDAKKIGPGLQGLSKRGTFTVNQKNKVTTQSLKTWIENGDTLMPPFKTILNESQIKDVVAYVQTL